MSTSLTRFLAPAVLAAGLGAAALAAPAPAQAQSDDLVRVLVNVADVVMRGNQPYYRYGDYGYNDRLIVQRDRYGRPVYYRSVPRVAYRQGPPYGNAYGYNNNRGYNQGYGMNMRVTAITNVERRRSGLRVSGLIDSNGGSYPPNGQAYGYHNQGYAATGDLSFRCNVDYRGAVSEVRIRRANTYRG